MARPSADSIELPPESEASSEEIDEPEIMPPSFLTSEDDPNAYAINELLRMHVGRKDEIKILQLLNEAPDLNKTLRHVKLKVMFGSFRNHTLRQSPNRTHLLSFLGKIRILTLDTQSKVLLVAAIARKFKGDVDEQVFVLEIFQSMHGTDLHYFKHKLDQHNYDTTLSSLHSQVFTDARLRSAFEAYIESEAKELMKDPTFEADVHALSDIDDTFVHSGYGLGGPKYPKGSVLPGVVTLFTSLNAHVVFVTARPAAARKFTYRSLKILNGVRNASVLTGRLRDSVLIPFKPDIANEMIASRKVCNFHKHLRMFPECRYMWFGDSGQSDIEVGIRLMEHPRVIGAYIQDVARDDGIVLSTTSVERERYAAQHVYIAENYVDVALHMHARKLLTDQGLHTSALDAAIHLVALRSRFSDARIFSARAREMSCSLSRVNSVLGPLGFAPVLMPVSSSQPDS